MSRYKILDQHGLNFLTLTVVDWVDVFIRKRYKDIIIDSLQYCQKEKNLLVYAYVIMSSHIHLITEAGEACRFQKSCATLKSLQPGPYCRKSKTAEARAERNGCSTGLLTGVVKHPVNASTNSGNPIITL